MTYWVWSLLGNILIAAISSLLVVFAGPIGLAFAVAIGLAWVILIAVAVFRSANAYQRRNPRKLWGRIAQIMVCLGILSTIGRIGQVGRAGSEDDVRAKLDKVVAGANAAGPHMTGSNVRFDNASRDGKSLVYAFTITGPTRVPSQDVVQRVRNSSVARLCKAKEGMQLLMMVDRIKYQYANEGGENLMSFDVSRGDCSLE